MQEDSFNILRKNQRRDLTILTLVLCLILVSPEAAQLTAVQ